METSLDYFTSRQLAEYLNVSEKSIIKWREKKRLPGAVKCGHLWRFRRADIEKKLLSGTLLLSAQNSKA